MADVFISYAREDRETALRIAQGLSAMGLEAFWDTDIPPGQTWADYIEAKLVNSKAAIVLWSAHSTRSHYVREEARIARDKSRLIPALIEATPLPFGFGEVQTADLTQWRGDYNDQNWTRFAQAVYATVRGPDAAPPPRAAPPVQQPPVQQPPAWRPSEPAVAAMAAGGASSTAAARETSPLDYIKKCFRLYANGQGRARRAEYWWWALFSIVALVLAVMIDSSFGLDYTGAPANPIITGAVWLALLAPGVSVLARRLHDINKSGWIAAGVAGASIVAGVMSVDGGALAMLASLLSLAAVAVAIVIGVMPGTPGPNTYGPDPKAAA